jgi:ABC-type lipoprotein release transport system permease subunit
MSAVWLRFRSELRARWRAWLGLALLTGLTAGAVMTLAAGARRTDSAYPRFLRDQRAGLFLMCKPHTPVSRCKNADLARVPGVAAVAPVRSIGPGGVVVRTGRGRLVSLDPNDANHTGAGEVITIIGLDDRFGRTVQREKILEGRSARPDRADEVTVNFAIAEAVGIEVGDRLRMKFALLDPDENIPDDVASAAGTWTRTVRVVGLEVSPFEVPPPSGQWEAGIHLTPAFAQRASARALVGEPNVLVALRDGTSVHEFKQALHDASLGFDVGDGAQYVGNVERGITPQVVALMIVAALAALAAVAVLGAVLTRVGFVEAADVPMLRALGMKRSEFWSLGALRGIVIGSVAAVVAVVVAFLASPLMPIGQARILEPTPGFGVDGIVVAGGVFATIAFVTLLATAATWRAVRSADDATHGTVRASRTRPSLVDTFVTRLPVRPAVAAGARTALDSGSGANAVPVRSTIAAISVGLAVLVAALVFSASLGNLLETPAFAGWNWTVAVPLPESETADRQSAPDVSTAELAAGFSEHRDVLGVVPGTLFRPFYYEPALELGPRHIGVEILTFEAGSVGPSVISGRAPVTSNEILLGPHTLDELNAEIGDHINATARLPTEGRDNVVVKQFRIVGTGVVPLNGGIARLGRGATLTLAGAQAIDSNATPDVLWLRVAPGADPLRVVRDVKRSLGLPGPVLPTDLIGYERDNDLTTRINSVNQFPLVLAALMSVMAAGVGVHVLVVGSRRRRRDLSILATLGFVRSQVRAAVAWQATAIAAVALVFAVPVGVVAGQLSWRLYAESLGVVPTPTVPWIGLIATAAGVLLVARLLAIIPGAAAARTRPAAVLRSE